MALVRAIHAEHKAAYGSPRMLKERRARGFSARKERVERLRRENGFAPATSGATGSRRMPGTTCRWRRTGWIATSCRQRRIGYGRRTSRTGGRAIQGWWYLVIVLDLFRCRLVAERRMTADRVTDALTLAWFRKRPAAGLLHHSDRGSQYASEAFQEKLKE